MHVQAEHGSAAEMPCMSFWCMFAGVVMQRLQAVGVRSILLTSGTLSPLAATAEELCVPMPVRLENPHVVKPSQVRRPPRPSATGSIRSQHACCCWVASKYHKELLVYGVHARLGNLQYVVLPRWTHLSTEVVSACGSGGDYAGWLQVHCSVLCKGPSAVALNSSYGNRDCSRFKHDLCAAVRAVAEATRGGVLVFFPSHASMKGITDVWRKYGGYRELEAVKAVFTEPRTAHEFQQVCAEAVLTLTAVPCVLHASIYVS